MPRTDSNIDPFLQSLLEEREADIDLSVEWDDGNLTLEDWQRLLASPAWKEMARQMTQTLQTLNGSWRTLTDLAEVRHLAGRAVQLELILRLPYETVRALEAQTTQPQPSDPEGEDE